MGERRALGAGRSGPRGCRGAPGATRGDHRHRQGERRDDVRDRRARREVAPGPAASRAGGVARGGRRPRGGVRDLASVARRRAAGRVRLPLVRGYFPAAPAGTGRVAKAKVLSGISARAGSPSLLVNARSSATSLKVCTIPEVGEVTRISVIERASPRPISCRRGLPPKEPPLVTDRRISL